MTKRRWVVLFSFLLTISLGVALAQTAQTPASQTKEPAPNVTGDWTGVWFAYNPSQPVSSPKELCKALSAKVLSKEGVWEATFEGECGRPYKYTIKMEGRQVGKAVLFKGTTDLGPKDGGVYDWIGRANEKEFVGFFTSGHYTGSFALQRAIKKESSAISQ
jgi:hypothetical protein